MHSSKKDPVILFFIAGSMPNSREMAEIFSLGSNVRVRNGVVAEHTAPGAIEICDGVNGTTIPDAYKSKPDGHEVLHEMRCRIIEEIRATEPQQEQEPSNPERAAAIEAAAKQAAEKAEKVAAKNAEPKPDAKAASGWTPQK